MRQEIEVALLTLNGNKFVGKITHQEAKFSIYRDSLGFDDFSNFVSVCLAFRGVPVVVFKLKSAITVDKLIGLQNFEFNRKSTHQGRSHNDVINCKIKSDKFQASKMQELKILLKRLNCQAWVCWLTKNYYSLILYFGIINDWNWNWMYQFDIFSQAAALQESHDKECWLKPFWNLNHN